MRAGGTYDEEIHKRINHFEKGRVCRWNVQKMRSESSEYVGIQRVSSQTVGESKYPWRATLKSNAQ